VLTLFTGSSDVPVDLSLDHSGGAAPGVGFDPRLALRLRSFLIDLEPAAVVAHGSEPLKYLVPAMVGHHRPMAYYAIGTYSGSGRGAQERIWRFLLGRPDLIIAEGEEVRAECMARFGVPGRKVVFVPNGRDPTTFRPRPVGPRGVAPRALFVGALTTGKRPERFIAAVQRLRARGTPFSAGMVGDGPLRPELVEPATAAEVELLGSRSDVADLLRQADVLVFPSLPTGEGMPGVLIEAGLSGLPSVATDVPGVRSIVDDGVTGFVVGPSDMDALVAALGTLLDDAELRASMGAAARQRCVSRFSIDSVTTQWSTALQPLLVGAGPECPCR
jgi:glycosyltransferase involved in cell wall biosynthesis